jgi:hypothetical protein
MLFVLPDYAAHHSSLVQVEGTQARSRLDRAVIMPSCEIAARFGGPMTRCASDAGGGGSHSMARFLRVRSFVRSFVPARRLNAAISVTTLVRQLMTRTTYGASSSIAANGRKNQRKRRGEERGKTAPAEHRREKYNGNRNAKGIGGQ